MVEMSLSFFIACQDRVGVKMTIYEFLWRFSWVFIFFVVFTSAGRAFVSEYKTLSSVYCINSSTPTSAIQQMVIYFTNLTLQQQKNDTVCLNDFFISQLLLPYDYCLRGTVSCCYEQRRNVTLSVWRDPVCAWWPYTSKHSSILPTGRNRRLPWPSLSSFSAHRAPRPLELLRIEQI